MRFLLWRRTATPGLLDSYVMAARIDRESLIEPVTGHRPATTTRRGDDVRRASWLAMLAGADFIKTSTGKISPAATPPVVLVMLEAVRDFHARTGRRVGVKAAGGIRTAKDAIKYLVLVNETAGEDWLTPEYFRLGASSLLNDLLMQRRKLATGRYGGADYFTLD